VSLGRNHRGCLRRAGLWHRRADPLQRRFIGRGLGEAPALANYPNRWRAGVLEELFYRGYAIERLEALGLNRFWAGIIPLLIFGVAHWTGGWANIVIALVLGAVLTLFYLWRRDLVANMIGHFMVDFIANVLPRLL